MIPNFLSIAGMILTALAFITWSRQRLGRVWPALIAGGLLWIVAIALKMVWGLRFNVPVLGMLQDALGLGAGNVLFLIYVGLLTGVFECGLIYLALRFIPWFDGLDSNRALAIGFGFGALEALLIGFGALIPTLMFIFAPDSVSPAVAAHVRPLDWAIMPAATIERISTIFVHGFTTYLIVYAVRLRRSIWFWAAFVFKSAIDVVAAWGQLSLKLDSAAHIWLLEAIVVVFGAFSVWGIVVMRRRWAETLSQD